MNKELKIEADEFELHKLIKEYGKMWVQTKLNEYEDLTEEAKDTLKHDTEEQIKTDYVDEHKPEETIEEIRIDPILN